MSDESMHECNGVVSITVWNKAKKELREICFQSRASAFFGWKACYDNREDSRWRMLNYYTTKPSAAVAFVKLFYGCVHCASIIPFQYYLLWLFFCFIIILSIRWTDLACYVPSNLPLVVKPRHSGFQRCLWTDFFDQADLRGIQKL